jgi:photosystem II stability/assembly factor-like uncharacterized protein
MFICLSPGGQMMTEGESANDQLLVGTAKGIFSFARRDGSWTHQGTFLRHEHVSALLFEPSSGMLFAGTYGTAHYASSDLGQTWERRDRGIGGREVYTLACRDSAGRPRLYAGTQPAHLFYSDDLGQNWTELPAFREVPGVEQWTFPGAPHQAHLKRLAFTQARPDTIYAAVEVGGFLKSQDGGNSWTTVSGLNPDAHQVFVSDSDAEAVYLVMPTTNAGPQDLAGICVSRDGGETWASLTARDFRIGYVDSFLVHPRDSKLMFTAGGKTGPGTWRKLHTADARIARSRDGGNRWTILNDGLPEHIRANIEAMAMDVWHDGFALFAGTTDGDVFYSCTEGERWERIIQGIGPVSKAHHHHNLALSAA